MITAEPDNLTGRRTAGTRRARTATGSIFKVKNYKSEIQPANRLHTPDGSAA